MSSTPPAANGPDADNQLDALISRIQSLTGNETDAGAPKQQPRPARPAANQPAANQPAPSQQSPAAGSPVANPSAATPAAAGPSAGPGPAMRPQIPQRPAAAPTQSPTGPAIAPAAIAPGSDPRKPGASAPAGQAAKPKDAAGEPAEAAGAPKPTAAPNLDIPPGPLGFTSSRDEAWRPIEPESIEQSGINESILEAIIYRYLLTAGESEGRKIADQVKLPFRLIEPILTRLKMEQNIAYKNATATNDYVYILTETGRNIARNHNSDCTYFGSCPVQLEDYIKSVRYQTIEGQYPKKADLVRAFSDLLINPKMLNRLGPAVASGRGMFLFGFPGNGKTSIAERVTGAFGKYIWIPRSVDVDGDILRVFDPMNHVLAMPRRNLGTARRRRL